MLRDEMARVREELELSNIARRRLGNIVTMIGIIGLVLWISVIALVVRQEEAKRENLVNTKIGGEILTAVCQAYTQRTKEVLEVCGESKYTLVPVG
jgi:hypothetical protein